MRITDIEGLMVRLPEVRVIGDGCQTILIILVHTDAGITGIGEAHTNPLVSKAILDAPLCSVSSTGLKHLLVGEDPRDINRLYDLMIKRTQTYGRRGAVLHVISGSGACSAVRAGPRRRSMPATWRPTRRRVR
jgi:L-rhamnonate dehydratase